MNHQGIINLLRKAILQSMAEEIVRVQPMNIRPKVPETWQSYLSRLGNGLNGVATNQFITEENIVANAQGCMQILYPGPYTVEPYYNSKKMKIDLRLKFNNPQEEIMWLLRWS